MTERSFGAEPKFVGKEMTKVGVIHGRFQILHKDHMKYLLAGKERCEHLVVGVTNPDPNLTGYDKANPERSDPAGNPLTYYERYRMTSASLLEAGLNEAEFSIVPFPINFPELYRYYVPLDATFYLTIYDDWGLRKLELFKAAGLKTEVLWSRLVSEKGLSASEIRRKIALGLPWQHLAPAAVSRFVEEWDIRERLRDLERG
jgi:nicotinamide mononucleotide adenylyltransferase